MWCGLMRERKRDIARWAWFSRTNSAFQFNKNFGQGRSIPTGSGGSCAVTRFLACRGDSCRLKWPPMAEKKANFVPVSALDKRIPTKLRLLRGMVGQAPFVAKNFQLYFRNAWRRHILRTKVVAPYAVTFYVTHKCNLACSYCTQKEPDVFSEELPTAETIRLMRRIRKETDSLVITGGEPTLRSAIEELVDKIIERRRSGTQPINGTPRTTETLLRFGDFQCYPTMFPRVYPNGDVFYPCEPLRKVAGNLLRDGSLKKIFARGKKIYGDIPPCQGICYLFGNVLSHYYVNDFWGLAGDFIR